MTWSNCRACAGESDVTDLSCLCKNGYMNKEGTFIPGALVRSGRALSKEDYENHKSCPICDQDPSECDYRLQRLALQSRRRSDSPEDNYFEFFVSREGIAKEALSAFLRANGGREGEFEPDKQFKGKDGYLVKAKFRFDLRDIQQLRQLSEGLRHKRGLTRSSLSRSSPGSHGVLNEFTHFLRSSSVGDTSRQEDQAPRPRDASQSLSQGDRVENMLRYGPLQVGFGAYGCLGKPTGA